MTEWEVTEVFDGKIAAGWPFSQTPRDACGALADWVAREWERLSPDNRELLVTVGAVLLWLSVRRKQERSDYH
jgi:hypothetical protein